jgi:hypothetical protein
MDEKKKRRRTILIVCLALLPLIAAGVFAYLHTRALEQARARSRPPQVFINEPGQGDTLPSGQITPVTALAQGYQPLRSIELWANGHIVEEQQAVNDEGTRMLYGHFDFLVEEGVNTIFIRAVDVTGHVGASLPISITGERPSGELFELVSYGPESTLEGIAEEYGVDPERVAEYNPDAFGEGAPPEGVLEIPIVPDEEKPELDLTPGTSGTGTVEGKICYPSEHIPAMTAFFENTSTMQSIQIPIQEDQHTYQVALPPATYIAYAFLPDYSLGGAYTQAVPCGLTVSCVDHTPIPITVQSGATLSGIDICDWNLPIVPPAPQPPGGGPTPTPPPAQVPSTPMLEAAKTFPPSNALDLPWTLTIPDGLTSVPANLAATLDGCNVRLTWSQIPSGVQGYAIWMTSQDGAQYMVAKLKPGDQNFTEQWYEFTASVAGKVTLWVESFNSLGTQTSNPVSITIPTSCQPGAATNLRFEALEVQAGASVQQVYAYISLEGVPEMRVPSDDSVFVQISEGRGSLADLGRSGQKVILPRPTDGDLLIEGECWGWRGGDLQKLSDLDATIPESQWGGSGTLGDANCQIVYSLAPAPPAGGTLETYEGDASGFPAPFNVRSTQWGDDSSLDPYEQYMWFWERVIQWQWKGDIKDITGFTIMMDGEPLKAVAKSERGMVVELPGWCGPDIQWQVVANGTNGQKATSETLTEQRPHCTKWAKVTFDMLHLMCTCDGYCKQYCPCSKLEGYFWLQVNLVTRKFFGGNFFVPLTCGQKQISYLTGNRHEFVVTLYDGSPVDIKVYHKFYDYDTWSGNDLISSFGETLWWPDFEYGARDHGEYYYLFDDFYDPPGEIFDDGMHYTGTAKSYSRVFLYFYPKPLIEE